MFAEDPADWLGSFVVCACSKEEFLLHFEKTEKEKKKKGEIKRKKKKKKCNGV